MPWWKGHKGAEGYKGPQLLQMYPDMLQREQEEDDWRLARVSTIYKPLP